MKICVRSDPSSKKLFFYISKKIFPSALDCITKGTNSAALTLFSNIFYSVFWIRNAILNEVVFLLFFGTTDWEMEGRAKWRAKFVPVGKSLAKFR